MMQLVNVGRVSALFLSLFVLLGGAATSAYAQAAAAGATFGEKPTFQSASNFEYIPSGDKQAFTITFNPAFEAAVGGKTTDTASVGTNVLSLAIPVSGGKNIDATVTLSASVTAEEGASGLLMLVVNDKQMVTRFKKTDEKELLVNLRYRSKWESELRITVFLLAERDAAHPKAAALIHMSAINGDLAPGKKKKDKKGKK